MNQLYKLISSTAVITVLAGCGGGGDGAEPTTVNPSAAPVATAPATADPTTAAPTASSPATSTSKYSQADIQSVVNQGLTATYFAVSRGGLGLAYLGGLLSGFSNVVAGSTPPTEIVCAAPGSYNYSFTKSEVRAGFEVGDQLTLSYSNCWIGSFLINGRVTLTLQSALASSSFIEYDIHYEAEFSDFSIQVGDITAELTGLANVNSKLVGFNAVTQQMSVPLGQTVTIQSGNTKMEFKGGSTLYGNEVNSPNSASYGLNGDIDVIRGGKLYALSMSTPTLLGGSTSSGIFLANSGVVITKDKTLQLATSVTFNDSYATVSGDTDGDDILDFSFISSWTALAAP